MNKFLLKYELKSMLKDYYVLGFGLVLPTIFAMVLPLSFASKVPKAVADNLTAAFIVTNSQLIVLSILLVSFGVTCALEFKSKIPKRLIYFNVSYKEQIIAKLVVHYLAIIVCIVIYFAITLTYHNIAIESFKGFATLVIILMLEGIGLLLISYGVALLSNSFGITYTVVLGLYMLLMFASGSMGVSYDDLPKPIQVFDDIFVPLATVARDANKIWSGNSFDVSSFLMSWLALTLVGLIITVIAIRKRSFTR